jgi:Fic-DOC domain mobile mystery protein B
VALTGAQAPGATPLRDEDIKGLKHAVTTFGELNELEAANIVQGQEWALKSRLTKMPDMLSDDYLRRLHKRMYGDVWKWAGKYRDYDTNIGVTFPRIWPELRIIYDDARHWIDNSTFPPDELVIRLHHRLVWVHPFSNGNGRLCRMMADLIMIKHFKLDRLPWGGDDLVDAGPRRAAYIEALHDADVHDYTRLLKFCRSTESAADAEPAPMTAP